MDTANIERMEISELHQALSALGLSTSGKKASLVKRLLTRHKAQQTTDNIQQAIKKRTRKEQEEAKEPQRKKAHLVTPTESDKKSLKKLVKEIELLQPENLTLLLALDFASQSENEKLPLLMLAEKIELAAFGLPVEEIYNRIVCLKEEPLGELTFDTEKTGEDIEFTELMKLLKNAVPEDGISGLNKAAIHFLTRINKIVALDQLVELFSTLFSTQNYACADIGRDFLSGKELVDVAKPLHKKAYIFEVLELLQALRRAPYIDMTQGHGCSLGSLSNFDDIWFPWLEKHPVVQRYLDPPLVMVQPVGAPPIAPVAGVMASLPAFSSGIVPFPLPDPLGGAWVDSFQTEDYQEAHQVATALRTHLANSAGGL